MPRRGAIAVDVSMLTHIDTDGDGIITRAEVKDASTGAIVIRQGAIFFPAILACAAGVLFYLSLRWLVCKRRSPKLSPHALHHTRPVAEGPLQPTRAERRRRLA